MKILRGLLLIVISTYILQSCAVGFNQPVQVQEARIGEQSSSHAELVNLPKPVKPIIASVYKFRDQTGQYKNVTNGSSFSTVVTQGATSILLKAMEDSGWFITIERENQNNLLTERQLIRSSQQQFLAENPNESVSVLPALTYANMLLEGGIISYDHNLITGGAGLRYFGVGGSTQYRQDRVTVYLRAVSTKTGEILKTVYVSKTLLSQALDGNIFKYVRFQRILEAETGFSYNEPSQIVVTDAIEKALHSLIVEGIEDGYWSSQSSEEEIQTLLSNYNQEKRIATDTKLLNRYFDDDRRGYAGIQLSANANQLDGDYSNPNFEFGGKAGIELFLTRNISLQPNFKFGKLSVENGFSTNYSQIDLSGRYIALPHENLSPYLKSGFLVLLPTSAGNDNNLYTGVKYDAGVEYLIRNQFGLFANGGQTYLFTDKLDGAVQGKRNDQIWNIDFGLSLYLGRKAKSTPVAGVYGTDYLKETQNENNDTE